MLLDGVVNGHEAQVLLDSGADISVVPEDMIAKNQLCNESVAVKSFGATTAMLLPMAEIEFCIGNISWKEKVAVAPTVEGGDREVLCSLNLQSERGLKLVLIANGVEQKDVARVTTRAQAKADSQEVEEDEASVARDMPIVRTLVPNGQDASDEPGEEVELEVIEQECLGRPEEEYEEFLGIDEDASEDEKDEEVYKMREKFGDEVDKEFLGIDEDASEDKKDEEVYKMREKFGDEVDIEVPPVKAGSQDRAALVATLSRVVANTCI